MNFWQTVVFYRQRVKDLAPISMDKKKPPKVLLYGSYDMSPLIR